MSEQSRSRKPIPEIVLTDEQQALLASPPPHTRVSVENGIFTIRRYNPAPDYDRLVKGLLTLAAMCPPPSDGAAQAAQTAPDAETTPEAHVPTTPKRGRKAKATV